MKNGKFNNPQTLPARLFFLTIFVILFTCLTPRGELFAQTVDFLYASTGYSVGAAYSRPLGIFYDTAGQECYVADTGNHQVVICDSNGMPIYRFAHYVNKNGNEIPGEPKSIAVDDKGRIFLTDASAAFIDILNYKGASIKRIYPRRQGERFDCLALGPESEVYASISGEDKMIAVIDPDLRIRREITLDRIGDEHPAVSGLAVDSDGTIYILDPGSKTMVQVFDTNGKYLSGFGHHDTGFDNFSFPSAIAVTPGGNLWIADALRQIVSCFSAKGEFITFVGGKGYEPGAFNYPSGLSVGGEEKLFVLERVGGRYQCFQLAGSFRPQDDYKSVSMKPLTEGK